MFEHERRDAQLARLELLEDLLRVVGAVVLAHTGMVPADDEVGAPIVLPADGVPDRLPGPGVPHRRREHRDEGTIPRVVVLEQGLVTAHTDIGRNVVPLRGAHQRVQQQPVDDLKRALLDVLVSPVDRVAGLEPHHGPPAPPGELGACLRRRKPVPGEGAVFGQADGPTVAPPWHTLSAVSPVWHPLVRGADREFLESFEEPGSGVILRFVGLYRLRAIGNLLTNSENRLADDIEWRIAERHQAEVSWGGEKATVTRAELVSGRHRRLVWSFYVVDGKIAGGLIETKLLQARAVLLRRASLAALVAVSASMDDLQQPAATQLARFLAASQPFPQYLDKLERETKTAARAS